MTARPVLILGLALVLAGGEARAALHQFSYDPADAVTRSASGPVTILIDKTLFGSRVLKLRSTEAKVTADLSPADPGRLPGEARGAHGVYRVTGADEGPDLVAALCPGSKRAWLAFTSIKYGQDLKAVVFGDNNDGRGVKACRRLAYYFHGEWTLPSGDAIKIDPIAPPDFPN
ncbi:MAG TPA: hypothetical protein VGF71_06930 [Caulobacteraceae bacterium]|jgi:hypothetical protein